jgi:hypothetical protein
VAVSLGPVENMTYNIQQCVITNCLMKTLWFIYTVKPVLRGYLWDKEKVAFKDR